MCVMCVLPGGLSAMDAITIWNYYYIICENGKEVLCVDDGIPSRECYRQKDGVVHFRKGITQKKIYLGTIPKPFSNCS